MAKDLKVPVIALSAYRTLEDRNGKSTASTCASPGAIERIGWYYESCLTALH